MGLHRSLSGAENGANQLLYQLVENQSRMQAYNDIFLFSGLLFAGCVPLVILSAWRGLGQRPLIRLQQSEARQY